MTFSEAICKAMEYPKGLRRIRKSYWASDDFISLDDWKRPRVASNYNPTSGHPAKTVVFSQSDLNCLDWEAVGPSNRDRIDVLVMMRDKMVFGPVGQDAWKWAIDTLRCLVSEEERLADDED